MQPTCPFCQAPITEALALHGGPCPTCFAEIPGEETATDPGEEVKAQQAAADRAAARRRARLPLLVATPVALLLLGATIWALQPAPALEELRFEADDFGFEIELVEVASTAAVEAEPSAASRASAGSTRRRADDRGVATAQAAREPAGGTAEGTTSAAELAAAASAASASAAPVSFDARRTAAVLDTREDVQAAIGEMWVARSPRLRQCYERALKGNPELAGEWRLSFTIAEDGSVREPSATGVGVRDASLEGCIVEEMVGWRLRGRLERPWPVSFPIKFKGQEG